MLLLLAYGSPAQRTLPDRRAAIVCNLSQFVIWPRDAGAGETRAYCLLGEDPIAGALERLCRKSDREEGKVFRQIDSPDAAAGCHVLFVSPELAYRAPHMIGRLAQTPVFTVSDIPGFAQMGGMVEIVSTTERVNFHINLDAARRAGLTIKAPLLQIARVIQEVK